MAQIALDVPRTNLVTSGPAHWAILRLAAPTVAAMLTQSVVNEIDIVFFARLPSPESSNAQAALLPSLIILWIFGGSLSAISVGTQAFTARRFAEEKHHEAGAVLANAALFALVAGLIFTVFGYASMHGLLKLIVKTPGAYDAAAKYLGWRLLGIASMATTFAFKAFFDGLGKTHIHLVSAVVMNALNIILCLLLIFGSAGLGIPRMGIAGAGLAGFISTWCGLLIMVGYALHPENRARFQPFSLRNIDLQLMKSIVKLSVPSAVATIAGMTGFLMFAGFASKIDVLESATSLGVPANAAATTVIVGILKLTITACLAFGTSTATLVAQSLGEKDGDKAAHFGWTSVKMGLAFFGIIGLLELIFAPQVLSFVSNEGLVQARALVPMRMMGACTPMIAVGMILTQALFGAGNTKFVMLVELCLHFFCLVPLAYFFGVMLHLGLVGLWMAAVIYVLMLALIMARKFQSGDWKGIKI